jgi:mono/diheme cytochrome c family protein
LTFVTVALPVNAQNQDASSASAGERLFDSYCSACHQYDDQGMGEAPPLEDSPWVVGPSERLIRILLHGISGRIEIGGRVYDREMPGFGRILSNRDVAALATYTRQRFGAVEPSVTPAEVKRIRDKHADRTAYWPADELLELR